MDPAILRTRFAPSPTGHLHVGGARTALFCWAFARRHGGKFILRIEDTDVKRSSESAMHGVLEDLLWLGIEWDEGPEFRDHGGGEHGPYLQSQRLDIYNRYVERLIDEGKAYRAYETPEELEAAREKAKAEGKPYRYQRPDGSLSHADNRPHVVRFRVPENREITVHDQVLGDVITSTAGIDDFVIRKADGYPTYHFAVVVDDELMEITHVIRAQEHLANTPKHMLVQEALGFRTPVYAHISVITNPNGSKMSKREKDRALKAAVRERNAGEPVGGLGVRDEEWAWWLEGEDRQLDADAADVLAEHLGVQLPEIDVDDFRRAGYLPEVMVNYLALLGWNPGGDVEKFDRQFLIERFDLDRVQKSSACFDRNKLLAFNNDAITAMTPEEFSRRLREHGERYYHEFVHWLDERRVFDMFAEANQTRSKTLDDPYRSCRFFAVDDGQLTYEESKEVRKALAGDGFEHLEAVRDRLAEMTEWTVDSLEREVKEYADAAAGGKLGKVAQPLRVAVSGCCISPAIFHTLAILGRESTLKRIDRCLAMRESLTGA